MEQVDPFELVDEDSIDFLFNVNVKVVIFGTQAAAVHMKTQPESGVTINACSIAGHESYEMLPLYCTTKHAVRFFTHYTAK